MVIASAAPVAEAVPATSATPENSADEQSGGVSPTDRLCTFIDPCESWPVPPLLNLDQGSYVPTPEQKESLRALEAQAVANVDQGPRPHRRRHRRGEDVGALRRTRGAVHPRRRGDSGNGSNDGPAERRRLGGGRRKATVDWCGASGGTRIRQVGGPGSIQVRIALEERHERSRSQSFPAGIPLNFNNPNTASATGGWCVYRSPDPFSTDYTAWKTDPLCRAFPVPAFSGANLPTPTYDYFVNGARAPPASSILNSAQFQRTGGQLAKAIGVAVAAAAAIVAGARSTCLARRRCPRPCRSPPGRKKAWTSS